MKSKKTPHTSLLAASIRYQPLTVIFERVRLLLHQQSRLKGTTQNTFAQRAVLYLVSQWWNNRYSEENYPLRPCFVHLSLQPLPREVSSVLDLLEQYCLRSDMLQASYLMGMLYTSLLSEDTRTSIGAYFTPPNLTARLLQQVEAAGIHWPSARVLDPACGGGAFLAPVALKMLSEFGHRDPEAVLTHLETHLQGFEIDPFSAWMSQVYLDAVSSKYCLAAGRKLEVMVKVTDSLNIDAVDSPYDLVIGNPPYGKITLTSALRQKFSDSLYGHANYYGLFLHQSFSLTKLGGLVAFLTPTGFMAGEYFKRLREFIVTNGAPLQIDFIHSRKDVFEGVLQETVLATYRRGLAERTPVKVFEIHTPSFQRFEEVPLGQFHLPAEASLPWLLPRRSEHQSIAELLPTLTSRLEDWGYAVKTGPLVWNRKKDQLTDRQEKNTLPLIWAESVGSSGRFAWKADLRQHLPYFRLADHEDYLVTSEPCVLLQRTTAKEQDRRLITAVLPSSFLKIHGGAVVENHVNLIVPTMKRPTVSLAAVSAFLNTQQADTIFRCISGSVAVSAYELENMPLPAPEVVNDWFARGRDRNSALVFTTLIPLAHVP